ncbi:MAG: hypothetical protein JXQ83_10620, partial [Candidatus Glassbacteria bacterium]|nr:hypothetical protein [Candidatus Glassbacteria bacterium]
MSFSVKDTAANLVSIMLGLFLISTLACSERERANPFDPKSPEFGGMGGLNALAGNAKVYLFWGRMEYDDL